MALFRHPHLVRGTVHTAHGAFTVVRGRVEMPEEVGEALGWSPVEEWDTYDRMTRSERSATTRAGRVAVDAN